MKALLKRRHAYATTNRLRRLRRRIITFGISSTMLLAVSITASLLVHAKQKSVKEQARLQSATISQQAHATPSVTSQKRSQTLENSSQSSSVETPSLAACAQNCKTTIATRVLYITMPQSNDAAKKQASVLRTQLTQLSASAVQPLIIFEPEVGSDVGDDSTQTALVSSFEALLVQLKAEGVRDTDMGTWVFYPEPNVPKWTSVDPNVFTAHFTTFASLLKEHFKDAKTSILLSSSTYAQNADVGSYQSLLPYVKSIPPQYIDRVGYEGFPWTPPADSNELPVHAAADFLQAPLVLEVATAIGKKDVWLFSGTYATYYAQDASKEVQASSEKRHEILNGILEQASILQDKGMAVSMILFMRDTSQEVRGADWSYDDTSIVRLFTQSLAERGIPFGVAD